MIFRVEVDDRNIQSGLNVRLQLLALSNASLGEDRLRVKRAIVSSPRMYPKNFTVISVGIYKCPACPPSTVFRTRHVALTVFALDPLGMYVSLFITTLRPTRFRTNVYINPPKLLLDLARLRGSLFHPSERRSPAHSKNFKANITGSLDKNPIPHETNLLILPTVGAYRARMTKSIMDGIKYDL